MFEINLEALGLVYMNFLMHLKNYLLLASIIYTKNLVALTNPSKI